jgi:micrococcal nuclease
MKRYLFLAILQLVSLSCQPGNNHIPSELYQVTKVVDGDTFWAAIDNSNEIKIRLIGVDAPESRKTGKKEIGYFGKESNDYLHKLISGKKVRLEFDVEKYDQYRRVLAYVYLEDGTFVNAELLKQGYANVMTIPPNVKHADEFVRYVHKARRTHKGMWGTNGKR